MKEAKELLSKFRAFQEKNKLEKEKKRMLPTPENFFWLMDQLVNTDKYGKSTHFIMQDPSYYVGAECITLYMDEVGWFNDKLITVHQPTDINNVDVITEMRLFQKHSNPGDSKIEIATAFFDVSSGKYRRIGPSARAHVERNPERGTRFVMTQQKIISMTPEDHLKVIQDAYRIAYPVIMKRTLPRSAPVKAGIIQLPLQPRLI